MDNEAIVDQFVRSLSFEVVAMPQDIVQVDSTSKSTPLNVKIRVRKKNDAGLRHGVLSMPKVEQKDILPGRVRLVSSDQTIMSFNVVMEGEFDKIPPQHGKQNLNMVSPGLGIQNEENKYPPLSKKADNHNTSPILLTRNKDIFGRCKPGGCLDPPYGEDKYSYQPAQHNLSLPVKDDTTKLRSSSIFKNKLFRKKKKSSQDDDLYKTATKNTTGADSIQSLYENGGSPQALTTYSNSIITYPHPSNSSEIRIQDEKPNKKRYSSEDKSKSSVIEDTGSYFIIPKKTKNLINKNDIVKNISQNDIKTGKCDIVKLADVITKPENKNILRTTEGDDSKVNTHGLSQSEIDESKYISQVHNFIPIPLPAVINNDIKRTTDNSEQNTQEESFNLKPPTENSIPVTKNEAQVAIKTDGRTELLMPGYKINSNVNDQNKPLQTYQASVLDEKSFSNGDSILQEIKTLNYTNDRIDSSSTVEKKINAIKDEFNLASKKELINNEHIVKASDSLNLKKISDPIILKKTTSQDMQTNKFIDEENKASFDGLNNPELSLLQKIQSDQNVIALIKPSTDMVKYDNNNLHVYSGNEIESKSHTLQHDKALLKLTTDNSQPVRVISAKNVNDVLKFPEEQEHGKLVHYSTENLKQIWENDGVPLKSMADVITKSTLSSRMSYEKDLDDLEEHQPLEIFPYAETNQEDPKLECSMQSKQKEAKILQEAVPVTESEIGSVNSTIVIVKKGESVTGGGLFENLEKILLNDVNFNNGNSSEVFDNDLQDDITNKTYTIEIPDKVNKITGKDIENNFLPENTDDSKNSGKSSRKSRKLDSQSDILKQQQNILDYSDNYYLKSDSKATTLPSIGKDEITSKDSVGYKYSKNVSTQSILDRVSYKYRVATDASNHQEYEYFKNNLNTDLTKNSNGVVKQISSDRVKHELTEYKDTDTASKSNESKQIFSIDSSDFLNKTQPTTILRKGISPWKMDIALQSYTDENNDRIIKSFDSKNVPGRHRNDVLLVAQCFLGSETNEIKIPIDQKNDVSVQIKNRNQSVTDLNKNDISTDELHKKRRIKIDVPETSPQNKDYKDVNKSEVNKHNKMINGDMRDVLITIYEQELVPLQEIIKGLREEIDTLAAYQMKFREKIHTLAPKRSKPLRLVHGNKKCACIRKL